MSITINTAIAAFSDLMIATLFLLFSFLNLSKLRSKIPYVEGIANSIIHDAFRQVTHDRICTKQRDLILNHCPPYLTFLLRSRKPLPCRNMNHFLIFGTHPRLSLAELRAVLPLATPPMLINSGALVDPPTWDGAELMERLGGTVKLGDLVAKIPLERLNAQAIFDVLRNYSRKNAEFGLTFVGGSRNATKWKRIPIELKKIFKTHGRKSRWVTSKDDATLSPAAVAKLKLTTDGYDIVCFIKEQTCHVGLTTHVQDADAWSKRDYGRPARDELAGMLPPKLAHIMVNLAQLQSGQTLIDPFCGNGTILMEASIMNPDIKLIGSDLDEHQVKTTRKNQEWLIRQNIVDAEPHTQLFAGDVRALASRIKPKTIDAVVTEGSLGPLLKGSETQKRLDRNRDEIEELWRASFKALHPLLKNEANLVVIWPSYRTSHGQARVQLDAEVAKLGYKMVNPLEGWDERNGPLLYHRQGQKVGRRIVVLKAQR
ncbi:hypothetical protein GF380_06610 [Candidatus Uhrbacteria bacterium]|nr:hypothetical protein [Candidatus Uhrbacteria bacterium]MBD3284606.1 hypothetical protein [Candidatus Uhrbacteria bacterium]